MVLKKLGEKLFEFVEKMIGLPYNALYVRPQDAAYKRIRTLLEEGAKRGEVLKTDLIVVDVPAGGDTPDTPLLEVPSPISPPELPSYMQNAYQLEIRTRNPQPDFHGDYQTPEVEVLVYTHSFKGPTDKLIVTGPSAEGLVKIVRKNEEFELPPVGGVERLLPAREERL